MVTRFYGGNEIEGENHLEGRRGQAKNTAPRNVSQSGASDQTVAKVAVNFRFDLGEQAYRSIRMGSGTGRGFGRERGVAEGYVGEDGRGQLPDSFRENSAVSRRGAGEGVLEVIMKLVYDTEELGETAMNALCQEGHTDQLRGKERKKKSVGPGEGFWGVATGEGGRLGRTGNGVI